MSSYTVYTPSISTDYGVQKYKISWTEQADICHTPNSDSTALTDGLSTELMFSALRVLTKGLWLPPLLGDERGGMLRRLCMGGRGGEIE